MSSARGGQVLSKNTVVQWINKMTGVADYTTIDHAIRFTYFKRTGRPADLTARMVIGHSIGEDPGSIGDEGLPMRGKRALSLMSAERRGYDESIKRARLADESKEEDERIEFFGELQDQAASSNRFGGQRVPRGPDLNVERERLAAMNGDPVLLRAYFTANSEAPSGGTIKPSRTDFRPHNSRVKAHELVTSERHQGTNPMEYCLLISADDELRFQRIPAVLTRVYDLSFGAGGLSLMHFRTFTYRDEMAAREQGISTNTLDYSASVALPSAQAPTDWEVLTAAAANFTEYAGRSCDGITVAVAQAIERFLREQRLYELWLPSELPTVGFWIDSTLGKYHQAVMRDSIHGTTERLGAPGWFVESNPVLQRYRANVLDARYRATVAAAGGGTNTSPTKMAHDVLAAIPKRKVGNAMKQLCLRYMSVSGCKGRGDGSTGCSRPNCVHERPATINPTVGEYIKKHLGGLYPGIRIE